jgi:hypothetical protein
MAETNGSNAVTFSAKGKIAIVTGAGSGMAGLPHPLFASTLLNVHRRGVATEQDFGLLTPEVLHPVPI